MGEARTEHLPDWRFPIGEPVPGPVAHLPAGITGHRSDGDVAGPECVPRLLERDPPTLIEVGPAELGGHAGQ